MRIRFFIPVGVILLASCLAGAGEAEMPSTAPADKSGYTLFNPTPAGLLRDFNPNRPDATESPTTIDAGHVQLELSFLEYTHDSGHGVLSDQFNVLPTGVRVGVLNNVEVDVFVSPYFNTLLHGSISSHRQQGAGDTQIRGTINFWGDDGGPTAAGMFAFVSLPTGFGGFGSHHVEGGVSLPFALELPGKFEGGAMIECDFTRTALNEGYGANLLHTFTVGHQLFGQVSAYVEYAGISPISIGQTYQAFFDTGMTWAVADNVQLDTGINIGLSRHASDYTLFTGLSFRL